MQWTVQLEVRTSTGEVTTTELVTISRPGVVSTLAEVGLMLEEAKALLAKLQASMLCGQVAAYAAHHRVCAACGVMQPLKDRRTRRLQMLYGTVEVDAPRFKLCRCRPSSPMVTRTVSPVCALLTARCTPELERVQAELGACTSFRDAARILDTLLPASPANQESVRIRTHVVAPQLVPGQHCAGQVVEAPSACFAPVALPEALCVVVAIADHCIVVTGRAPDALRPAALVHEGEAFGIVHQTQKVDQVGYSHDASSSREPVRYFRSRLRASRPQPRATVPTSPPRNPIRATRI